MGTYTKSSINRTARPRSERLRELGGLIVPVSAAAASGGAAIVPTGTDHTHANLADLNRISITDGYIYITDEVIDPDTQETSIVTDKAMAGYADRAGANADGYTLDWFIPVTVDGSLTLKLNPIYAGLWAEGFGSFGGVGSGGGGGGSTVSVTQIVSSGTAIATITVDGVATTIYAPSGGGTSVSWGTAIDYIIPLTVDGTTKNLLLSGALTGYATQSWVTGQGYLTSSDLSSYATQTWVGQQGYATQTWVGQQGFLTSSNLTGYATQSWVQQQGYLTSSSLSGYATESWVTNRGYATQTWVEQQGYLTSYTEQYQGTVTSVTLTSGTGITVSNSGTAITSSGSRTISISSTYRTYISHGETAYGWGDHSGAGYAHLAGAETFTGAKTFTNSLYGGDGTDIYWSIDSDGSAAFDNLNVGGSGVVTIANAQTITGAKTFSGGGIVMTSANILTAADSTNNIGSSGARFLNGHIRNLYTTYFAFMSDDGQTQRGNIGMGDGYANIIIAGTPNSTSYNFNATYGFFHGGDETVPCGRDDHRWSDMYSVGANLSGSLTFRNSADTASTGLVTCSAGYMIMRTGADIGTSYKQLTFHETNGFYPEQSGVNLGANGASYRWANIYGVNLDLTGDLKMAATQHVDIGPLRIEYDPNTKCLHITKVDSNDTNKYGLYTDGPLSGAGVAL